MTISFGFLASAMLAVLAQAAPMATTPVKARWDVSWEDGQCTLSHIPLNDRDPAFSLTMNPGDERPTLRIAASRKVLGAPSRTHENLTLQLGPGLWTKTSDELSARNPDTNMTVIIYGRLDPGFLDQFAHATELSLSTRKKPWIRIPLIGAGKAAKVLRECINEKLVEFGFDPKALVGLRSVANGEFRPFIPPQYRWTKSRARQSGRSVQNLSIWFVLTIAPDGRPDGCKIVSVSKNEKAEQATCSAMMNARFKPAIAADGRPIRAPHLCTVTLYVRRDAA